MNVKWLFPESSHILISVQFWDVPTSHQTLSLLASTCRSDRFITFYTSNQVLKHGLIERNFFERDYYSTGIVVDHTQALKFAIDIARGMSYLHQLDPLLLRFYLSSKHVVVSVSSSLFDSGLL